MEKSTVAREQQQQWDGGCPQLGDFRWVGKEKSRNLVDCGYLWLYLVISSPVGLV